MKMTNTKLQTRKDEALRKLSGLSTETVSYMNCYCHEDKCTDKLVSFVSEINTCIGMLYGCTTELELLELEDRIAKFDDMINKKSKRGFRI
jgi:hypothetical protein